MAKTKPHLPETIDEGQMVKIDPRAIVSPEADIGDGSEVGPFAIIEKGAVIGRNCKIGAYSCIYGRVKMGDENVVYPHASIGAEHQFLRYKEHQGEVIIGNRNVFREFVTVHPGTPEVENKTIIGDDNYLMIGVHIAHDCKIGNRNILSNLTSLAGCVEVGDDVTFGGMCGIHQWVRIGSYAMIGGGTMVQMDVPPFCLAAGNRAELHGINEIGLKRRGFTGERIFKLKKAYKILFVSGLSLEEGMKKVEELGGEDIELLLSFIKNTERGILPPAR